MTDALSTGKNKILYVEILRVLAILFVLFNHTRNDGYTHFTLCAGGTFSYWFWMFFSIFCKFSVPLFFMISGMMLLGKEESLAVLWKKRILKFSCILVLFSLFQYLWECLPAGRMFSVREYFLLLYSKGVVEVYWFLYLYLAFLMMLPFLRKIAQNLKAQEFNYLVVLMIVFGGLIPAAEYLIFKGTVTLNVLIVPTGVLGITFFYPLIGYYLGIKLKEVTNKTCLITAGLFVFSMAVMMFMTDFRIRVTGNMKDGLDTFYQSLQPLVAIFVFLIVRRLFENKTFPKLTEKFIISFGGSVFGIYLIEKMVREALSGIFEFMYQRINRFLAVWIGILIMFIVSAFIVSAFKFLMRLLKPRKKTEQ